MNLVQILVPRFRVLDAEMRLRDGFYELSRADRDAKRLERLNARWREALSGSEYYGNLARERKLPATFDSLEQFRAVVPVTPKEPVRQNPKAFKLSGNPRGKWMLTGGSTGIPLNVFWGLEGQLESLRDQYWARTWWGVQAFDRQAMIWGHSRSFGLGWRGLIARLKIPVVDRLRNRKRFSAYKLDHQTLRKYYDGIVRFRPKVIYAYPSAAHLLAMANMDRAPMPHPPKAAFLAAEPLLPPYRKSIEHVFACPAVGEYGSIDCGMLAHECPSGGYRVMEHSVLLETVPNDEGYTILVSQLRKTSFPLFRYELGDMVQVPLTISPEGFETLHDISGRIQDVFQSPTGKVFYGGALCCILEEVPGIQMFRVIQRKDYSLDVYLQAASLAPDRREWIEREFFTLFGGSVALRIHLVDQLPRTSAGKFRWIVSELS